MNKNELQKYVKQISKQIDKSITIYDLETSGLDVKTDQIIQFCGIRINPDGSTKELMFICKPTCQIHPKASETHGRTNASLEKEKPFKNYINQIIDLFDNSDIGGYNISKFDNLILSRQMEENGIKNFLDNKQVYDAYSVYCNHINKKLAGAVNFYSGKTAENCHDALQDVKYTILITGEQIKKENKTIAQIISVNEKAIDKNPLDKYIIFNDKKEPILNFSKHKGKKVSEVDKGFFKWVIENDFPADLKAFLKEALMSLIDKLWAVHNTVHENLGRDFADKVNNYIESLLFCEILQLEEFSEDDVKLIESVSCRQKPHFNSDLISAIMDLTAIARERSHGAAPLYKVYVKTDLYIKLLEEADAIGAKHCTVGKVKVYPSNQFITISDIVGFCQPKFDGVSIELLTILGAINAN